MRDGNLRLSHGFFRLVSHSKLHFTAMNKIVECIPNFSEGRDAQKIELIALAIGSVDGVAVLDRTLDADHNRAVVTFAGLPDAVVEAAMRAAATAVELIDLNRHIGEH